MIGTRYCLLGCVALAFRCADVPHRHMIAISGATFEGKFSNLTRRRAGKDESCAMCGEFHNRTGICMLKLV